MLITMFAYAVPEIWNSAVGKLLLKITRPVALLFMRLFGKTKLAKKYPEIFPLTAPVLFFFLLHRVMVAVLYSYY